MCWNLFLDDERFPPLDGRVWTIARSYEEACAMVLKNGVPDYISFDHDLGAALTGYDFAKFLAESDLDNIISLQDLEWFVHSQNPIGKRNIEEYLNSYLTRS